MRVGLLVIATQPVYAAYAAALLATADTYFFPEDEVTYFLFTDQPATYAGPRALVHKPIDHKPWPNITLDRYETFSRHAGLFQGMDYLFYSDADSFFVSTVGREIAVPGKLQVVRHPGYVGKRGTPETRPESTACIRSGERMPAYVCGGFNGGPTEMFLEMARVLRRKINIDKARGVVAVFHDESHLNRYVLDHVSDVTLLPSTYCSYSAAYPGAKLVCVDKGRHFKRT